ncbi:MAG: acyl-CoA desaturase, partial [Verrucomicrobiales bacterium]
PMTSDNRSFSLRGLAEALTLGSILFFILHGLALLAFFVGVSWTAILLCLGMFVIRMFGITGGFHRYFSHRSFKTSRVFQFLLAWLGTSAGQKGALWWAAHHRHHHKHSDTPDDLHSAKEHGFYWSHVGWILSPEYVDYDAKAVRDLSKFPELRWLDKWHILPPLTLAIAIYAIFGLQGFIWGFCVSTVFLYHATFAINSFCHVFGKKRFETGEESKNSFWLAIPTLGEGWHNNHHHYPSSTRQGIYWWEFDPTFYVLKVLSWVGVVWDLRPPSQERCYSDKYRVKHASTESRKTAA